MAEQYLGQRRAERLMATTQVKVGGIGKLGKQRNDLVPTLVQCR
jgi:hypothetical protein